MLLIVYAFEKRLRFMSDFNSLCNIELNIF